MTRGELIKAVAKEGYEKPETVRNVLGALENVIVKTIGKGENVNLFTGFKLRALWRDARDYNNPKTGKVEHIDEGWKCNASSRVEFIDKINGYKAGRKIDPNAKDDYDFLFEEDDEDEIDFLKFD